VKTINPYTEEVIEDHALDSREDLQRKLERTAKAFRDWRAKKPEQRAEPILKLGTLLEENRDSLTKLMVTEMGKLIGHAQAEVDLVIDICRYSAEEGPRILRDQSRDVDQGRALVTFQPIGTIFSVQPWNFPLYQVIRNAAPLLVSGNAMMLSHAPNVWGSAKRLVELFQEAGVPEGIFDAIYADDEDDLSVIYDHDSVRGVTFTGSAKTGAIVATEAAKRRKKSMLELGGSDAYLVFDDADIERAVEACVFGRFHNNGQVCTAAKRFIVQRGVYDDFRDAFRARVEELSLGDPMDEDTDLGPMARQDLLDKLVDQVKGSIDAGAKAVIGGEAPDRTGYFYAPTILERLEPGMPAYDEELFGPVASFIPVADEDEAVKVANSSRFGLGGGIFCADEDRAIRIAKHRLDTGMVNINGYSNAKVNVPFGGVKDSGYGREHDEYGFLEFVNIKAITVHEEK